MHVRGHTLLPVVCFSTTAIRTLVSFNGRDNTASIQPEEKILPLFYPENGHSSQLVSPQIPVIIISGYVIEVVLLVDSCFCLAGVRFLQVLR